MYKYAFLILAVILIATPVFAEEGKIAKTKSEEKSGLFKNINFEEGTFLGNANVKFMNLVNGIEEWRLKTKEKIGTSLDKIETRREDGAGEQKTAIKVLTVLHIALLAVLLFLFSLQFVFWTVAILLTIAVIRRIVRSISGLIRRDHITA